MTDREPGKPSAKVEVDVEAGQVRAEVDAVTPRELYAHLGTVTDKIEHVEDTLGKRITRIERVLIAVVVAVGSPKLGGPSVSDVVAAISNHI